jgi:hypothetical protein
LSIPHGLAAGWSSAPVGRPNCLSRPTRTCCGMRRATRWPTLAGYPLDPSLFRPQGHQTYRAIYGIVADAVQKLLSRLSTVVVRLTAITIAADRGARQRYCPLRRPIKRPLLRYCKSIHATPNCRPRGLRISGGSSAPTLDFRFAPELLGRYARRSVLDTVFRPDDDALQSFVGRRHGRGKLAAEPGP